MGKQFHCYIIKTGLNLDSFVSNNLIDMYIYCGSLEVAQKLFECIENRDILSWGSLVVGYAKFGYREKAFELFKEMLKMLETGTIQI